MKSTDVVEDATPQEIQWWKGWQVKRAIRHKGAGVPTVAELELPCQRKTCRIRI